LWLALIDEIKKIAKLIGLKTNANGLSARFFEQKSQL